MKRSEMLQVIINATETYQRGTLNPTRETYADFLLTQIELAGMVPPQRVKATYDHTLGGYTVPNFEFKHEWEPEQ